MKLPTHNYQTEQMQTPSSRDVQNVNKNKTCKLWFCSRFIYINFVSLAPSQAKHEVMLDYVLPCPTSSKSNSFAFKTMSYQWVSLLFTCLLRCSRTRWENAHMQLQTVLIETRSKTKENTCASVVVTNRHLKTKFSSFLYSNCHLKDIRKN